MKYFIKYLFGILFMTIGFLFFILYFNLFVFGYSLGEYFLFLIGRFECYSFLLGVFFIAFASIRKEKKR